MPIDEPLYWLIYLWVCCFIAEVVDGFAATRGLVRTMVRQQRTFWRFAASLLRRLPGAA